MGTHQKKPRTEEKPEKGVIERITSRIAATRQHAASSCLDRSFGRCYHDGSGEGHDMLAAAVLSGRMTSASAAVRLVALAYFCGSALRRAAAKAAAAAAGGP